MFSATLTDTLNEVKQLSTKKPFFWEAESKFVTFNISLFVQFSPRRTLLSSKALAVCPYHNKCVVAVDSIKISNSNSYR